MKKELSDTISIVSKKDKCEKSLTALKAKYRAKQEFTKAQKASVFMPGIADFHRSLGQDLLDQANCLLVLGHPTELACGREAMPALENRSLVGVRETLKSPGTIGVEASSRRLDLLADADAVSLGVDAAESIQAHDSLEKMLVHQMAVAHKHSLRLMAKIFHATDNLEALRITNASVRLMLAYQLGIKVLQKIRSGGRQVVVVQHVKVSEGGQPVIAGEVQNRSEGGNSEEA
jgi:hypothetical protein